MQRLVSAFLLAPALAFAHPGHGKPGFFHDHTPEDLALGLIAVAVVGLAAWVLVRVLAKKKV